MTFQNKIKVSKYKQTMIEKFGSEQAWKEWMLVIASKGGKNGTGHLYAHGKADPSTSGKKGAKNRWNK